MARIDAINKVLGKKIYARDLRAKDIYGWGNLTHHALILRAIFIDRIYLGLDTGYIQTKFNPYKILTSQELENDGFDLTVRYISDPDRDPLHKDLFAKVGTNPEYVGQPTALLLFERYADFFDASRELKGLYRAQIYGEQNIENIETINLDRELKQWLKTERIPEPNYSSRQYFGAIDNDLEAVEEEKRQQYSKEIIKKHHAITFKTSTPSIDPMFLEPESTLTRIYENDNQNRILEIYVGTQAPDKDKSTILALLRGVPEAKKINKVEVLACHLGGGFGGRDLSTIPLYSAIAAFYSHPIPVRLAYDRFEQFQCGTKRHASIVENTVAIDKAGNLKAILSHFIFDGGSVKDLTSSVAGLATLHVAGPYQFEHWNLNSVSLPSKGPLSGSMRGFGIPQVCFNIEQIIDSIASKLKQDPIDFRLKHLLKEGDKDVSNQILHNNLNNDQICHIAKSTPIWQNREQIRKTNSDEEVLHGVGFAMTMEAFGTTNDGCYVVVSITEKNEFVIETEVVEMGQGALTSLASVPKKFFDFDAAQIYQGRTDNFTDQFQLESRDRDHPRYVYAGGSSTSASKTAFFHVHILEEACQLYLEAVIDPVVKKIFNRDDVGISKSTWKWEDRSLYVNDLQPISWEEVCKKIRELDLPTSMIVHGSFHNTWSSARFAIDSYHKLRFLDAVGTKTDHRQAAFDWVERKDHSYPSRRYRRSLYASCGYVIHVEINCKTGRIHVKDAICILDAGDRLNEELVKGQIEGGLAMGLGFALTEKYPSGPLAGQRYWNLDTYKVPRLENIPLENFSTIFVELPENESVLKSGNAENPQPKIRKKGIAEATMTSVAPAVANAVAHALEPLKCKSRVSSLPITSQDILTILHER